MKKGKRKIIQHYNLLYLIPQISIFLIITLLLKHAEVQRYGLLALSLYMLTSGYVKIIIPKWHRKGLFYVRKGEFEGAIYAFNNSYTFFAKFAWVDNYRAFALFSISRLSYREMALMNIIFCYEKLEKTNEAKNIQRKLKTEFPENPYGYR